MLKNYKSLKDQELMVLLANDDSQALEVLFERYYQELCNFSLRILKSNDLAQEVVADVFLKIWLNRTQTTVPTSLKPYLFSAVKNQSLNYLKKESNLKLQLEHIPLTSSISDEKADTDLSLKELETEIEILLNEMPPQRQLIFKMNRIEGLKYKEIAAKLSISVHTVQNQMVEAIKHISQKYPYFQTLKVIFILPFLICP